MEKRSWISRMRSSLVNNCDTLVVVVVVVVDFVFVF